MTTSLTDRDRRVIWHPYTQHKQYLPPIPVVQGKGSLLFDEKGKTYIDAISSWWVNIHGHAHPYIAEKLFEQAQKLEHVIFTGFTHEPAVQLAERLLPLLPGDFSKIFYSDNGSTAVEVAIKMAIQYWKNHQGAPAGVPQTAAAGVLPTTAAGATRTAADRVIQTAAAGAMRTASPRSKILAFRHSYHGDTFGAMSVSERSVFTDSFRDYLFEVLFIDTPTKENIGALQDFIRENAADIACFIYEPLLQAAGGMRLYEPALQDQLLLTLKQYGIITIADEVLTGFGRTGVFFAGEYLKEKADIICLSKGLTGGTMALGVTAVTEKIFEAFLSDDKRKTLFHGHSFTANPLACSVALASLDLLQQEVCLQRIRQISRRHLAFLDILQAFPIVRNARSLGTVLAFEISVGEDQYINAIGALITEEALSEGIYLRPLGNTVYIMPPYCTTEKEMDQVYSFLVQCIDRIMEKNIPTSAALPLQ